MGSHYKNNPPLLFDSTRKILCQHIKEVTGDHKLHSLFRTVEWEVLLNWQLQWRDEKFSGRCGEAGKNKGEELLNRGAPSGGASNETVNCCHHSGYKSESVSLSHTLYVSSAALQHPHVSSTPPPQVSTVSGLLYCLQYFKFPLKCLAWQVVRPFPLQLQACGVSQMGLLKK